MKKKLLFISILLSPVILSARDSSFAVQYFGIETVMYNDDNPISNQKPYENRRRDDHGITLSYGYSISSRLKFSENLTGEIKLNRISSLYTKGLNSTTDIDENSPYFDNYAYLAKKHPDWGAIHVNNQIAYSKQINEIELNITLNQKYLFGLQLRSNLIASGEEQKAIDFQRTFHQRLKARNYFHVPFTDSSLFGGENIRYSSVNPSIGFLHLHEWEGSFSISAIGQVGCWINFSAPAFIKPLMPNAQLNIGLHKAIKDSKQDRFSFKYSVYINPNEIVQLYANPGSSGYHFCGFNYHLTNIKKTKKNFYYDLSIRPYSIYIPFGKKEDNTFSYKAPENDLRWIEGFFNLSFRMVFDN